MKHYLYVPFLLDYDTEEVVTLQKYFGGKNSGYEIIFRADDENWTMGHLQQHRTHQLQGVENDAVLTVAGHGGRADSDKIEYGLTSPAGCFAPEGEWTANNLAQHLIRQGLNKGHIAIRLMMCYGVGTVSGPPSNPVIKTGTEFFAAVLATALYKNGFTKIVVGGYPGLVGTPIGQKKTVSWTNSGEMLKNKVAAKGMFRWFNGEGKVVPRPYNK